MFAMRFAALWVAALGLAVTLPLGVARPWLLVLPLAFSGALAIGAWDLLQARHAIRRNYPILAHLRFLLEKVRPEIRQYFIESDTEAAPYSRAQRAIVYQRAKRALETRPLGTQLDVYAPGYEWIHHSVNPAPACDPDFRITIGGDGEYANPGVSRPYSASVLNISAMSFGALSANAIRALNRGAKLGGFAHDTGEGSVSRYHREFGGDLVWEIGSGYFGCRTQDGRFDADKFARQANEAQIKLVEIKLSQGAKPGHGGMLPGAKVTVEIAEARGVAQGEDCISPPFHSAFSTPIEMLHFVDKLRQLSGGKPTGFKFCVGHPWEWFALAKAMHETGVLPDFIVVDGSEGGTGAAPVEFTDHVGMPLREGLTLVRNTLVGLGLRERIRIGASGKMVTAFDLARAMALGADWCNMARGFMFAVGCLQALTCHTGRCPTGVTTQDPLRQRALVVDDKAQRVASFHKGTLHALAELVAATGLTHPHELRLDHVMRRISPTVVRSLAELLPAVEPGALLTGVPDQAVFQAYWPRVRPDSFALR